MPAKQFSLDRSLKSRIEGPELALNSQLVFNTWISRVVDSGRNQEILSIHTKLIYNLQGVASWNWRIHRREPWDRRCVDQKIGVAIAYLWPSVGLRLHNEGTILSNVFIMKWSCISQKAQPPVVSDFEQGKHQTSSNSLTTLKKHMYKIVWV